MQTTVASARPIVHPEGDDRLFLAGHKAPAGLYRLVETDHEVRLDQEDDLPATCDGRVAVYEHHIPTWAERQSEQSTAARPQTEREIL